MSARVRYLLIAFVVMACYGALAIVVSLRVSSAPQLGILIKLAIYALVWGFCVYGAFIFRKHLPPAETQP